MSLYKQSTAASHPVAGHCFPIPKLNSNLAFPLHFPRLNKLRKKKRRRQKIESLIKLHGSFPNCEIRNPRARVAGWPPQQETKKERSLFAFLSPELPRGKRPGGVRTLPAVFKKDDVLPNVAHPLLRCRGQGPCNRTRRPSWLVRKILQSRRTGSLHGC